MAQSAVRVRGGKPKLAGERVFDAAADLFYRKGIHAVGVDEVVKTAGVAKISLYRTYESKDELIVAYLENRRVEFWRLWDEAFAAYEAEPRRQLRAIMEHLAARTTRPGYRGCPFINYCAEFPDRDHPGRKVAERTKREMRQRFVAIARALVAADPGRLADGLMLLVDGAYALSLTLGGSRSPARSLVAASDALVAQELAGAAPQ